MAHQPYQAPPRIIYVYGKQRYAPDAARTGLIVLGALTQGVGSIFLGRFYVERLHSEHCGRRYQYDSTGTREVSSGNCLSSALGPLAIYTATMAFAPTAARFAVGANQSGWIYAGAITASIAIGKVVDSNDSSSNGFGLASFVFGFVAPVALGIVSLASTPHREDLAPSKEASVTNVGLAPIADKKNGVTGATVALGGMF